MRARSTHTHTTRTHTHNMHTHTHTHTHLHTHTHTPTHTHTHTHKVGAHPKHALHGLVVRLHEFFLQAIGQHRAADIFQLRLELLVVDMTDVAGRHQDNS